MKTLTTVLALTVVATVAHAATSLSYVQDGLLAQWDGIENVGRGQHDATARFWADISGNGHTFTNFIDALSWNEDSLQMPSSAYMKAATLTGFTSPSCVSFEVVYKQSSATFGNAILFAFDNFRGLCIPKARTSLATNNGVGYSWTCPEAISLNAVHHVYASYADAGVDNATTNTAALDGVALEVSAASQSQGNKGNCISYSEKTDRSFYGCIYAIRVYSRPLTAAEREWNRQVDEARFNDGTEPVVPATVTPVVSVEGEGTVSPVTATPVGETLTVTATPATGYAFGYWTGDVPESVDRTSPTVSFAATPTTANLVAHFQKIVYVAEGGSDENGGTSWQDAFATIATALASCDNPYVQLGVGTFASDAAVRVEKAATIAGLKQAEELATTVKLTKAAGAVFLLAHPHARVTSLKITTEGKAYGRGVAIDMCGLVDNCAIFSCSTYQDTHNVLFPGKGNTPYDQGGGVLLAGGGVVRNCVISNCYCWCNGTSRAYYGGGVRLDKRGLVENCKILDCHLRNSAGGGVGLIDGGVLRNSLVSGCYVDGGNSSGGPDAPGVYMSNGRIENCTIAGNAQSTSTTAAGVTAKGGILRNTIIWGNTNQSGTAPNSIAADVLASYCTSETLIPGEGNRTTDPMFKDAAHGDYTLTLSDCVDAGSAMPWHDGAVDLKGDPRVIDDIVDFGCYEFKTSGLSVGVSATGDGKPDLSVTTFKASLKGKVGATVAYAWTITGSNGFREEISGVGDEYASVMRNLTAGVYEAAVRVSSGELTADGAATFEIKATHTYVAVGGTGLPPYAASNPGGDIQTVLDSTADNGTVHLAPGFYTMPDTLSIKRPVRVLSDGGRGAASVYMYPMSSSAAASIVYMDHAEAVLDGVLVSGWSEDRKKHPGQNEGMSHGITIANGGGTVTNGIVDGVSGHTGGAGIVLSAGLVIDSIIRGSYVNGGGADKRGSGVRIFGGTVSRCVVSNNTAQGIAYGGGVYLDGGRLENSLVVDNVADRTGGGVQNVGGTVVNCLVCDNVAAQSGTGVFQSNGSLLNLTIADNRTNTADVVGCNVTGGTMKNCIVWGNEGTVQLSASDEIAGDSSNWWAANPLFKSVARGDYRLKSSSKCIDKGDDTAWEDLSGAVDLKGGPRLLNKHVDIGCYECALRGLVLILY